MGGPLHPHPGTAPWRLPQSWRWGSTLPTLERPMHPNQQIAYVTQQLGALARNVTLLRAYFVNKRCAAGAAG